MAAIVADFKKIMPGLTEVGVKLGDGFGVGEPVINEEKIWFNGLSACGHAENRNISIPWPAKGAKGVGSNDDAIDGSWFAGASLKTRACDGDCSYETFSFPRVLEKEYQTEDGYFSCTKTAYRPYDLAVTAVLIIAKHHCPDLISVASDGEDEFWQDAKQLCQFYIGYGEDFEMRGRLEVKEAA